MDASQQRGYTVLVDQLDHLVHLIGQQDPNIGAAVLFGSTARLTPRAASDVDLLVLCHEPRDFIAPAREGVGMSLLGAATRPGEEWGLIPVVSNLKGSDLPEALLANIARDGVLVYQQPGAMLPPALAHLPTYAQWRERVQQLLERRPEPARRTRPA
jgi:hypothetical protein